MSIFKAQKELQKQFERQVGAGQYLDRFEDATLSRGRLIAGQRLLPHGVILSKDLKAKAAKKKRKVKRTSKGLKGEVARIKKQQKIFEKGQRRRPGEEQLQIVGEPYVDARGRVSEDPEIAREKIRAETQRNQAIIADRQAARAQDAYFFYRREQERQDILAEERQARREGHAIQGQRLFADLMIAAGGQAVDRERIQAETDRLTQEHNFIAQRDRQQITREAERNRAEQRALRERVEQDNRERDAVRAQALEETRLRFEAEARQREAELTARGLDNRTEQERLREEAQTARQRDAHEHIRELETIQAQRAQQEARDIKHDRMLEELAGQNRALQEHIFNLPDPVPERSRDLSHSDKEFIQREIRGILGPAGRAVDRRIGQSEERLRQVIEEHLGRTGRQDDPEAREAIEQAIETELPHDIAPVELTPQPEPAAPVPDELELSSNDSSLRTGSSSTRHEPDETYQSEDRESTQYSVDPFGSEREHELRAFQALEELEEDEASRGTGQTFDELAGEEEQAQLREAIDTAQEEDELDEALQAAQRRRAQRAQERLEGGGVELPGDVERASSPRSSGGASPRPPVIQPRPATGTAAEELEELLGRQSPASPRPLPKDSPTLQGLQGAGGVERTTSQLRDIAGGAPVNLGLPAHQAFREKSQSPQGTPEGEQLELGLPAVPVRQEAEPEQVEPGLLQRAGGLFQGLREGVQEALRPETAPEALRRVEREATERALQEPLLPVEPGQQAGGILQTPEGVPIRGFGQEIEQGQVREGYQVVGGQELQAPQHDLPRGAVELVRVEDVPEEEQGGGARSEDLEEGVIFEEVERPAEPLPVAQQRESARLWTDEGVQRELDGLARQGRPTGGSRARRYIIRNNTQGDLKRIPQGEFLEILGTENEKYYPAGHEKAGQVKTKKKLRMKPPRGSGEKITRLDYGVAQRLIDEGKLVFERINP